METNETSKEVTGWLVNSQNSNRSLRKTWHFLGPGVGFVNDLWLFQKEEGFHKKISGKKEIVHFDNENSSSWCVSTSRN